jgi:dephospho-CoA kinase
MESIIGVTGPIASGKGIIASRLESIGYSRVSLSDEVRKEARRLGLPDQREVLQNVGDSLRSEFGNNVLAQRVAQTIEEMRVKDPAQKVVVDGLRNPGEITYLQEHFGMYTIGVNADEEVRINRVVTRARESDPTTDTYALEVAMKRDMGVGQAENGNNVGECLKLADRIINNNGTKDELNTELQEVLTELGIEGTVSSKEERF